MTKDLLQFSLGALDYNRQKGTSGGNSISKTPYCTIALPRATSLLQDDKMSNDDPGPVRMGSRESTDMWNTSI